MSNKNLVVFQDSVQRTIIGEQIEETDTTLVIKNPVVVNITPQYQNGQPTGQMALQLLPVFFKEFLGDKDQPVTYNYQKNQITKIDFEGGFDFRLYGQYDQIFQPSGPVVMPQGAGQVQPASPQQMPQQPPIQLFDSDN